MKCSHRFCETTAAIGLRDCLGVSLREKPLVRAPGLEPGRPKSRDFKSLASTNSAMPAFAGSG